jgi:hypothetical protein
MEHLDAVSQHASKEQDLTLCITRTSVHFVVALCILGIILYFSLRPYTM